MIKGSVLVRACTSRFHTDEEHVGNKISEGPNQTNSKYNFSLFTKPKPKPYSSLPAKPTTSLPQIHLSEQWTRITRKPDPIREVMDGSEDIRVEFPGYFRVRVGFGSGLGSYKNSSLNPIFSLEKNPTLCFSPPPSSLSYLPQLSVYE